jgi:reverse gyrase
MICPVCGGRQIGKVGIEQYYCWDCCVEFNSNSDKVVVYNLEEDGSLIAWEDFYADTQEIVQALAE